MADPVKADMMWRQVMATELRSFRNPTCRPQSAPRLRDPRPRPSSASKRPQRAPETRLRLGDAVTISGMQRRSELNGTTAEIVRSTPDAVGRLQVRLTTPGSQKTMRVRADRLLVEDVCAPRRARPASAGALGRSVSAGNIASIEPSAVCAPRVPVEADVWREMLMSAGSSLLSTPATSYRGTPLPSTTPNLRRKRNTNGNLYQECYEL